MNKKEEFCDLFKQVLVEQGPTETMKILRDLGNKIPAGNNIHSKDFSLIKSKNDPRFKRVEGGKDDKKGPIIPFF